MRHSISGIIGILLCLSGCHSDQGDLVDASTKSALDKQFAADLSSHDVIIIGENHGTQEVPRFVADLSDNLASRTLFVLELRADSAEMTCPPTKFTIGWQSTDGRSSKAMLSALCRIRANAQKHGNEILYMDDRSAEQPTFYKSAAAAIVEELASEQYDNAVVLTGNFHSSNSDGHLPEALQSHGLTVVSATNSTHTGTIWNCQGKSAADSKCGLHDAGFAFCDPNLGGGPVWTAKTPDEFGWDRCLSFPSVTASPPANKGK